MLVDVRKLRRRIFTDHSDISAYYLPKRDPGDMVSNYSSNSEPRPMNDEAELELLSEDENGKYNSRYKVDMRSFLPERSLLADATAASTVDAPPTVSSETVCLSPDIASSIEDSETETIKQGLHDKPTQLLEDLVEMDTSNESSTNTPEYVLPVLSSNRPPFDEILKSNLRQGDAALVDREPTTAGIGSRNERRIEMFEGPLTVMDTVTTGVVPVLPIAPSTATVTDDPDLEMRFATVRRRPRMLPSFQLTDNSHLREIIPDRPSSLRDDYHSRMPECSAARRFCQPVAEDFSGNPNLPTGSQTEQTTQQKPLSLDPIRPRASDVIPVTIHPKNISTNPKPEMPAMVTFKPKRNMVTVPSTASDVQATCSVPDLPLQHDEFNFLVNFIGNTRRSKSEGTPACLRSSFQPFEEDPPKSVRGSVFPLCAPRPLLDCTGIGLDTRSDDSNHKETGASSRHIRNTRERRDGPVPTTPFNMEVIAEEDTEDEGHTL